MALALEPETIPSPHGTLRQHTLQFLPNPHLLATLTFAVPQDHPLLLWKITLQNNSSRPLFIHRIEMLRVGFAVIGEAVFAPGRQLPPRGTYQLSPKPGEPAFFSNGWGSWNHTGAFSFFDRFKRTRLGPFTAPMRVNAGTPQPRARGHFASDMFAVLGDREHRSGFLVGFLSQLQHFGSIEAILDPFAPALSLWANGDHTRLDPGHTMTTDWACFHLDTTLPHLIVQFPACPPPLGTLQPLRKMRPLNPHGGKTTCLKQAQPGTIMLTSHERTIFPPCQKANAFV